MVRRKKTDEQVEQVPPVPSMKVVERREYMTPMQAAQPQEPQTITVQATPVDEESGDDLLDFLAELEEEIGLSLRVDRLPQYSANGKWHKGATFEFCDNIPINKSDLKSGAYMSTIRDLFGPAAYRCTLREVGAGIIKSWPIKIAAPIAQPQQRQSNVIYQTQPQGNGQPTEAPRDALDEAVRVLEKVDRILKLSGRTQEAPTPPAPVIQPTQEKEPLENRIFEAALNYALKEEKPETISSLLQSVINPKQDDFGWKEIIGEVVKPMIPMFMGLVSAYMQAQAVKAQQQAQVANGTQPAQQALQPMQPQQPQPPAQYWPDSSMWQQPQPIPMQPGKVATFPAMDMPQNPIGDIKRVDNPQPEDEDEMAEDNLLDDLVGMLQDCVNRAASDPDIIEAGRQEIIAFRARFPKASQMLDMLASAPPIAVIGLLSYNYPAVAPLVNNPVAVQVIEDLQAALKRPEVEE